MDDPRGLQGKSGPIYYGSPNNTLVSDWLGAGCGYKVLLFDHLEMQTGSGHIRVLGGVEIRSAEL